jgi:hypothetical protein
MPAYKSNGVPQISAHVIIVVRKTARVIADGDEQSATTDELQKV